MFRIAVVGLLAVTLTSVTYADLVWTPETGWYNPSNVPQSSAEDLLDQADKAFAAKRYDDAAYGYSVLIQFFPTSDSLERALEQLLESQFLSRDYDAALETSDRLLERKLGARAFQHALQRKYEIGIAYLTGVPRKFLGFSVGAKTFAVELLDKMVVRYPSQDFADSALFRIAEHYLGQQAYPEAEKVYKRLIRDYPQSKWVGLAEYQIGAAALARLKGVGYDLSPLDEAARRFTRYQNLYGDRGDRFQEADENLRRIDALRAQRLLDTAKFYQRERKPAAVRYYLQRLIRDHPQSPVAPEAERLFERAGRG